MGNETKKNILVHHAKPPLLLKSFCLFTVSKLLLRINDRTIEISQLPWLSQESNPFVGIPSTLIEEILEALKDHFILKDAQTIRPELLQILFCKRLQKMNLKYLLVNEEDVLPVLEVVGSKHSDFCFLDVEILKKNCMPLQWSNIPCALNYLKNYIRTLHSLIHLNVTGVCDDDMLEAIGASCPNLVILVAISSKVTSEGLKRLGTNPRDQSRRCQHLQVVSLDRCSPRNERLMDGIEALLLTLPQLRLLKWSGELLTLLVLKLIQQARVLPCFQLEELVFDVALHTTYLASMLAIVCPRLRALEISRATNEELQSFQHMKSLRTVSINNCNGLMNFQDGVTPFIQKMGKTLEDLTLYFIDEINLNVIDENCPYLKCLRCLFSRMEFGVVKKTPIFKYIEYLDLDCKFEFGLQPNECVHLLSNCLNLRCLNLECCKDLEEHHLHTILLKNPLTSLEYARISSESLSVYEDLPEQKWMFNYPEISRE